VTSLLQAVNQTRAAHGLRPLRLDRTLVLAARAHSSEMLRENVFTHGDFHGRMVSFHVHGPQAGENLAWGNGTYSQPSTIIAEWLASPAHRANLLHPGWTRIGIGLVRALLARVARGERDELRHEKLTELRALLDRDA